MVAILKKLNIKKILYDCYTDWIYIIPLQARTQSLIMVLVAPNDKEKGMAEGTIEIIQNKL